MANDATETSRPPLRPRWFYARDGDWVVFSESDDENLEARFQELGGEEWGLKKKEDLERQAKEEKQDAAEEQSRAEKEQQDKEEKEKQEVRKEARLAGADFTQLGWLGTFSNWWSPAASLGGKKKDDSEQRKEGKDENGEDDHKMVEEILDPDEPDSERMTKVAVLEDKLFDVDLEKMHLYPAFFKGVLLPIVRATWFYWSEVKDEYSPISWDSDLGQDLSKAWEQSQAWKLDSDIGEEQSKPAGKESQPLADVRIEQEDEDKVEKAKVQFKTSTSGSLFSEDLRGRVVSLVGGFTVIRGFDEVEKRTQAAQKGSGNFFDMPDVPMPWSNDDDDHPTNEAANQAKLNEAVKSTKKAGAAQPEGKGSPKAGGGGYGSHAKKSASGGDESKDASDNQGFAASLWPSSDSWLRPRFAFLKSLGFSSDDATEEAKRTQKQKNTEEAAEPESNSERQKGDKAGVLEGEERGEGSEEETLDSRKDDPVHLILVIHGIGQGLRDTFESLDFTWDVQKIRNLSRATAKDEGIQRLSRGRRVQYLPICWRRDLDFNYTSEENDNQFGLSDVTNDATIPFVRNIVSKVILDVPYYLSSIHKPKMIEAVTYELNRVYRLFIKRNPEFLEKGGKVSIIGHSLGSCLATDILSQQPTTVPPINELSHEEIQNSLTTRLLFNTTHLFLVGSPLGLFLHLGGGQLIARRTSSRSEIGENASLDEQGKYGCLAFSGNIYNCYNSADPVAYRLNGTVDQKYATLIRPAPLPGAVNAILDHLKQPRLVISKLFDPNHPFASNKNVKKVAQTAVIDAKGKKTDETKQKSAAQHKAKIDNEAKELQRYAETHDGAVDSLASRAALKASKMAKDSSSSSSAKGQEEQNGADLQDGQHDSHGPSGAMSPVRLEEGSSAKLSLPGQLVSAHADAIKRSTSNDGAQQSSADHSNHLKTLLQSLTRAEQRFRALNRHGCIDFFFEDSGSLSEYFSMLGAHNGYWTSASFVGLVLSQVFDDNEYGLQAANLVPNIEKPTGHTQRRRQQRVQREKEVEEELNDSDGSDEDDDDRDEDDDDRDGR
ncbi:unnamed protein product [Sympodiomycopsis kandeliae]